MKALEVFRNMILEKRFDEAFLGERKVGDWLTDKTWGGHDMLLSFNYFFKLIQSGALEEEEVKGDILSFFNKELAFDEKKNSITGGLRSLDLVRCYCIEAEDQNMWIISKGELIDLLERQKEALKNRKKVKNQTAKDWQNLREYLPALSKF
jgi:hypothetical protein